MHADRTAGAGEMPETAESSAAATFHIQFFHRLTIAQVVRLMIEDRISACEGDKSEAAKTLGVSLKMLYNRLNEYRAADAKGRA